MPDTTVLPPPSGICDGSNSSGGSSLATWSSSAEITTKTSPLASPAHRDINGTTNFTHDTDNTLKLSFLLQDGTISRDNNINRRGVIITGDSGGNLGHATIPNPSNPTSPSTLNTASLNSTPVAESFPPSPITPIQDDNEILLDSPVVVGSESSLSNRRSKKQDPRGAPPSSYYSTLALRQIKNLSNSTVPAGLNSPDSTSTIKFFENPSTTSSNNKENNGATNGHHPNRASISITSGNPLVSLANLARGISGTNAQEGTKATNTQNISRRKTVSGKRQSEGALSRSSSTDNLIKYSDKILATLTLEEALETTGNYSQAVAQDPANTTAPNMHQSSSRLLRMTADDRPFTRDFKDLFSTLMVSLPLTPHRLRFKTYYYTFTSDEAVNNLGSLKFSQSNRMPDPKDPSRIVTTTTTTTFSMAKEMARTVCQKFVSARFMEAVGEKSSTPFTTKNILWQITPKGIHVLERFCQRNGINAPHVMALLSSPANTMRLVILERDPITDKIPSDRQTCEIIFKRFAGPTPNVGKSSYPSDSDSISEYAESGSGLRITESRKVFDKVVKYSFTGKQAVDWLLDCCTSIEPMETHEIATHFVRCNLIQAVVEDKIYIQQVPKAKEFQPSKNAIYVITERGKRIAGWIDSERGSIENGKPRDSQNGFSRSGKGRKDAGENRETNTTRLSSILADPALRLLFREFLRETLCEENLSFWLDVQDFQLQFKNLNEKTLENIRETLAAAYGIYNAFLAPGSPCELNIDHTLRQDLAGRMTRAVAKDEQSMYSSLKEVAALFERAQEQVFKLMAGDSVPKFAKTNRYIEISGDNLSDDGSSNGTPPPPPNRRIGR